ncbi:MAG: FliH/SctL family protein [Candidatus Caenarcaniphilales bacterium]|nr:FliH/SctL family protein [Candidatus Caenarcaniphilales bacterium]
MLIKKKLFQEISIESSPEVGDAVENVRYDSEDLNPDDFLDSDSDFEDASTIHSSGNEVAQRQRQILEEAQREAQEIIKRSKLEAEYITSSAQESAQKELEKIIADRLNRLDKLAENANRELEELAQLKSKLIDSSKPILVDLAIDLTQKLIGRKIEDDREVLLQLLAEGVDLMLQGDQKANKLTLQVHPEDLSLAERFVQDLRVKNPNLPELQVRTNDSISLGSCMVESPSGIYDLNFSAQLNLFREKMLRSHIDAKESNESIDVE